MRILLFGKNGQLGWELNRTLLCLGELIALDYPEINFEKPKEVVKLLCELKPNLVVNASAYTDVDKAEIEKEKARLINTETPCEISNWCKHNDAVLIHYSTDYVFGGKKASPYNEKDNPNPINYYGITKLSAEYAIEQSGAKYLILRTAWLYSLRSNNFVTKIIEMAKRSNQIRVVDDQFGNPTWARALAQMTANILSRAGTDLIRFFGENGGLYHCAGTGSCSRYEWAKAIIEINLPSNEKERVQVLKAKSSDFSTLAKRPHYSVLDCERISRIFGFQLPHWSISLKLAAMVK